MLQILLGFHIHYSLYLLFLSILDIYHLIFALLLEQILLLRHDLYDYVLSCILHIHIVLHILMKLLNNHGVTIYEQIHLSQALLKHHVAIKLVQHHLLLYLVFHVLIVMLCGIVPIFHQISSRIYPYLVLKKVQHLVNLL